MDGTLGLLGGHGKDSASAVSKVDASSEASSYPEESEIELRLGLSLGGAARSSRTATKPSGRILTAQDFPSFLSGASSSSFCSVSGTKRAADSVSREGGPATGVSQVVGWPPIKPCRINSLLNLAKTPTTEDGKSIGEPDKFKEASKKVNDGSNTRNSNPNQRRNIGFVKVNMDGLPIGRKVDLNAHSCYETMAQALEDMFFRSATIGTIAGQCGSKLLNGSSEYVLTYEDKEGDWMLVGDVPWEMFVRTVKRLRIMKTSEANGLAPRSRGSNDRRNKPIYLHHLSVLS